MAKAVVLGIGRIWRAASSRPVTLISIHVNMHTPQPSPVNQIIRFRDRLEIVLLSALFIGVILAWTQTNSQVLPTALVALAPVFFISAFLAVAPASSDSQPQGFISLLVSTILPKVMWISCAISAVGIAFHLFHVPSEHYAPMIMIGGTTLLGGTLEVIVFALMRVKQIRVVLPVLYRAIPLLAMDAYILFQVL